MSERSYYLGLTLGGIMFAFGFFMPPRHQSEEVSRGLKPWVLLVGVWAGLGAWVWLT